MTTAKICGLTTQEALDAALDGGATHVGAVGFPTSPRHIETLAARTLFERARGRAQVVAVLVDPDDELLTEVGLMLRPDLVQLHGEETPERCAEVARLTNAGVIKALSVSGAADLDAAVAYAPVVKHLMFDARPPDGAALPGGVGGRSFDKPWFLAGGLDPANVAEAIAITGAPLVDVSSGVESAPGVKEPALISAFLKAVHAASPRQE